MHGISMEPDGLPWRRTSAERRRGWRTEPPVTERPGRGEDLAKEAKEGQTEVGGKPGEPVP